MLWGCRYSVEIWKEKERQINERFRTNLGIKYHNVIMGFNPKNCKNNPFSRQCSFYYLGKLDLDNHSNGSRTVYTCCSNVTCKVCLFLGGIKSFPRRDSNLQPPDLIHDIGPQEPGALLKNTKK